MHGRLDVDAMLEELTPQQLVEWRAAKECVPLDDGWEQAGTIAAEAHNDFEVLVAMKAGRTHIPKSHFRTREDFIKGRRRPAPSADSIEIDTASIDAHQAAMESRYARTPSRQGGA